MTPRQRTLVVGVALAFTSGACGGASTGTTEEDTTPAVAARGAAVGARRISGTKDSNVSCNRSWYVVSPNSLARKCRLSSKACGC